MRSILLTLLAAWALLAPRAAAQLDRSQIPPAGPAPAVSFPAYDLVTTENGIRVIVVRNTELPTVTIRMLIDRKPILEKEYAGVVDLTGQLLRSGTTKRTKDQLDEEIDQIGATITASGTSIFASGLSRHTEKLVELLSDIALRPSFPADELKKLIMQSQSGLKARKAEPDAIADVLRRKVLYGEGHPYGEVETEESVGRVTVDKCRALYASYFKPNAALFAVVGDVDKDAVVKLVKKYLGSWKKGTLPTVSYPNVPPITTTSVALVDRPASVQSVLRVAQTVPLLRTSPDVMPVTVMNRILGGGSFRLFMNLREEHSYTYGAYSSMGPDELIGAFTAQTSVRNSVTDSALTQIFAEIRRIRDEAVDAQELERAKNSLSGNFVQSLEVANTIATFALDIERFKLPKDYYRTYLRRVAAVTADDVQRVARTYLTPDKMLIAVVGAAKDIRIRLEPFGAVQLYDEDGRIVVEKPASAITLTADQILARFTEATGGAKLYSALKDKTQELSGSIQGMEMKIKTIQKAPAKLYQEVSMMGMVQKTGFDGTAGWASTPQGISDLPAAQLEALKLDAPIDLYGTYSSLGVKAEVTALKEIKGNECYEVTFTTAGGSSTRHYFDAKEFLKVREVTVQDTPRGPVEQVTDLFDYKDFQGYRLPTRFEQSVMGQAFTLSLVKCEINAGVDEAVFGKPAK